MDAISEARKIRTIVHDTPSLSAFLANNVYLPRLVALLEDDEDEAVAIAIEVIHFLVSEANAANRRLMVASAAQLLPRLQDMMTDIELDAKVKALAIKAYTNLQPYEGASLSATPAPSSTSSSSSSSQSTFKEVDADIINEEYPAKHQQSAPSTTDVPQTGASTMSIFRTAAASSGRPSAVGLGGLGALSSQQPTGIHAPGAAGAPLFTSSVSNRLGAAQTFTIFIKGLQNRPDNRAALEKKLLSVKGVISFSIFEEKAVVRAVIGEQELLKSVREVAGLVPSSSMTGLDDKENSSPQYLQRDRTRDAGNKGKIVVQDFKEKTDDANNTWFGRVARALWG